MKHYRHMKKLPKANSKSMHMMSKKAMRRMMGIGVKKVIYRGSRGLRRI